MYETQNNLTECLAEATLLITNENINMIKTLDAHQLDSLKQAGLIADDNSMNTFINKESDIAKYDVLFDDYRDLNLTPVIIGNEIIESWLGLIGDFGENHVIAIKVPTTNFIFIKDTYSTVEDFDMLRNELAGTRRFIEEPFE